MKIIIFDLDGTLVDNEVSFDEMRQRMAKRLNIPKNELDPLYEKLISLNLPDGLKILSEEEMRRAEHSRFKYGLSDLFEFLRQRRIKIAVLTRNCRKATLKALGYLSSGIDVMVTRDDGYKLKPSPEGIFAILNRFAILPKDALMVGDYDFDIEAGRLAGCKTVRMGTGFADFNVRNLEELKYLIKKLEEKIE